MPEPIDTAYVRIRPDFSGFQSEASQRIGSSLNVVQAGTQRSGRFAVQAERDFARFDRGVVAANAHVLGLGRSVAFASTAFLGGAGLGAVIRTGIDEFSNMSKVAAITNALLKSTGDQAGIGAAGIQRQATALEHLTGTDDEAVKSAENVLLCLEESAQALTRSRGWVGHSDLALGDEILAYDPDNDSIRWEPVLDVHRYEGVTELTRWQSKQIDIATTSGHRWWTTARTTERSQGEPQSVLQEYRFRTTDEVTGHQIKVKIGGGEPACFRTDPVYSDELVELAGWVMTEGSVDWLRPSTPARYGVTFTQSETANPYNVARIRGLVARLRVQGHEVWEGAERSHQTSGVCANVAVMERTQIKWGFAKSLGKAVRQMLPAKHLTPKFLVELTRGQAELLLEVLLLGDGSRDRHGHARFIQKDREQLGMVAMLAAMLGIRTTLLNGDSPSLYLCSTNHAFGNALNARQEPYAGIVWCPSVRTQVFLARNRGRTFWTGNSFRRIRNEVGRGNDIFNRATRATLDLARVFGSDAPQAARQLGRALADPERGVTLLRRAGVVFTADQIKLIKSLVASGQALKAQRLVLDQVERSVGGTAAAVGRTLPGRLDVLRERAKDALGEYVKRLSESKDAAELAGAGARGLDETWKVLQGTVRTIGPPLISAAKGAAALSSALGGVGPILAAVAAYKAVGITVGLAGRAQAAYARAAVIATGASNAETVAVTRNALAFRAQAGSAAFSGFSLRQPIGRAGISGAVSTGAVVGEAEGAAVGLGRVGVAGRAAAAGLGAARLGLAAIGGPLGATALGAVGLTLAFLALRRRSDQAAGSFNATRRALQGLSAAVREGGTLRGQLAGRQEDIGLARFDVQAAQGGVTRARAALDRSGAQPGSLEQRALAARLTAAERTLTAAERELTRAQAARDDVQNRLRINEQGRPAVIAKTTDELRKQIRAIRDLSLQNEPGGLTTVQRLAERIRVEAAGGGILISRQKALRIATAEAQGQETKRSDAARRGLEQLVGITTKLSRSGDSVQRALGGALLTVATTLNRLPTQKQITIAVRLAGEGRDANAIVARLLGITGGQEQRRLDIGVTRQQDTLTVQQQYQAALKNLAAENTILGKLKEKSQTRRDELQAAKDNLQTARDAVTNARENVAAAKDAAQAAREAVTSAREGLATSRENLQVARQTVAETVRQARDNVTQAVHDAKTNLDSLGQSIAQTFAQFADKAAASLGNAGPLSKRLRQLRAEVLAGGGGPETQQAAARLASQISRQQPAANTADLLARRFADLSNDLSAHKISQQQFRTRLDRLLTTVDLGKFQRLFGTAATDQLRAQIAAFRAQGRIIATGPQRPGGTFQATLVRPLQTVAQGTRDIAAAQKGVVQAQKDVVRAQGEIATAEKTVAAAELEIVKQNRALAAAERRVRADQVKKTEANTNAVRALTLEIRQQNKVNKAKADLQDRPKKPGRAGQASTVTTNAGANPP